MRPPPLYVPSEDVEWMERVPRWPGPPVHDMPRDANGVRQSSCCPGCPGGSHPRCCAFNNQPVVPSDPPIVIVRPIINFAPLCRCVTRLATCFRERLHAAFRVSGRALEGRRVLSRRVCHIDRTPDLKEKR